MEAVQGVSMHSTVSHIVSEVFHTTCQRSPVQCMPVIVPSCTRSQQATMTPRVVAYQAYRARVGRLVWAKHPSLKSTRLVAKDGIPAISIDQLNLQLAKLSSPSQHDAQVCCLHVVNQGTLQHAILPKSSKGWALLW